MEPVTIAPIMIECDSGEIEVRYFQPEVTGNSGRIGVGFMMSAMPPIGVVITPENAIKIADAIYVIAAQMGTFSGVKQ